MSGLEQGELLPDVHLVDRAAPEDACYGLALVDRIVQRVRDPL
jgi:hypothetical protein